MTQPRTFTVGFLLTEDSDNPDDPGQLLTEQDGYLLIETSLVQPRQDRALYPKPALGRMVTR